jgi:hypothetical protein
MKKFFTHDGTEQKGPFDLEDLRSQKIARDTPVWFEGLPSWTSAEKIEELQELFKTTTPPPFNNMPPPFEKEENNAHTDEQNQSSSPNQNQSQGKIPVKKKSSAGKVSGIIAAIIIVGAGLMILANLKKGGRSSTYSTSPETYQEKVMTVEEIEKADPTRFLNANGTYNENFWGTKFKVHCTISNKATVASYKDAVVRITFFSKTNTVLGSEDVTLYEVFPPTSSKTMELKVTMYKDVRKLGWDVVRATAI